MPEFVAVRCCECSLWQVVQKKKPQGKLQVSKWACRVCGKAQSVTTVAGAAQQAAALRPLVQELNMTSGRAREEARANPAPAEERVAVRVAFDPALAALAPDSQSSDSESGEALPLFRGASGGGDRRKRQRRAPASKRVRAEEEEEEEEEGEHEEPAAAAAGKKTRAVRVEQKEAEEDEGGDEGVTWARQQQLEVVQDEVWDED